MKLFITSLVFLFLMNSLSAQEPHSVNAAGETEKLEGNIQSNWTLGSLLAGKMESGSINFHNRFIRLESLPSHPTNTSIEDLLLLEDLQTYPVPATEVVHLSFDWEEEAVFQMTVYNTAGEKIISMDKAVVAGRNKMQLNIRDWPSGQYLIHLFNAEGKVAVARIQVL